IRSDKRGESRGATPLSGLLQTGNSGLCILALASVLHRHLIGTVADDRADLDHAASRCLEPPRRSVAEPMKAARRHALDLPHCSIDRAGERVGVRLAAAFSP